jgi:hypothetical protein
LYICLPTGPVSPPTKKSCSACVKYVSESILANDSTDGQASSNVTDDAIEIVDEIAINNRMATILDRETIFNIKNKNNKLENIKRIK